LLSSTSCEHEKVEKISLERKERGKKGEVTYDVVARLILLLGKSDLPSSETTNRPNSVTDSNDSMEDSLPNSRSDSERDTSDLTGSSSDGGEGRRVLETKKGKRG